MRTICMRVAEVIDGGTKSEFYADLRRSLDICVRIANIAITECARQDDWTKERPPKIYTYPSLRSSIELPGTSHLVASICRATEKTYKQDRWQVIRGKRSLRSFRSQPLPLLHNASTKTMHIEMDGERITARIKLAGGWWVVKLASGSNYRDQIAGLRSAKKIGDSKIWIDRKHSAIIGISADVDRVVERKMSGTMYVVSTLDRLAVATTARSDIPFAINGSSLREANIAADRRMGRLRQDRKQGVDRRKIAEQMNQLSSKRSRRMASFLHEASAAIVSRAVRAGVSQLHLDLTIKSYMPHFPWFDFATKIAYKCEDAGIEFVSATQTVADPQIEKPHVYFKFSPSTNRIKIGQTTTKKRHGSETDSPEDLIILAIDNQPKNKLISREKHYHSMFQDHRAANKNNREWFDADPVLKWLRAVGWLGNAGNLSQIAQFLDVTQFASSAGHLTADSELPSDGESGGCSHNAEKTLGYAELDRPAPTVTNRYCGD